MKVCINLDGVIIDSTYPMLGDFSTENYTVSSRYDTAVSSDGMDVVTIIDKQNERVGYCSFYVWETQPFEETVMGMQIDYVFVKEHVRGNGISSLMVPFVAEKIISLYRIVKDKNGGMEPNFHDNSEYVSDEGLRFRDKVLAFIRAQQLICSNAI